MVRTPHCAQFTDRIKNQWWMDGSAGGQNTEDISLSGAMVVSGSLLVIEALGWPKRMKTAVLYTAGLHVITSSVQADRNRLIHHREISLK